jgi:hypothetical protein
MFEGLKENWRELKGGEPGSRFVDHFERRQERSPSAWKRALLLAGLFMMIAPGPGILGIFIGGGLIAQESRTAARVMDWLEVQVRKVTEPAKRAWDRASHPLRVALVAISLIIAAGVGIAAYLAVT